MTEFTYAVVFIKPDNNVHHIIWYEDLPNVVSLKSAFDELLNDNEFGTHDSDFIDSLRLIILHKDELFDLNEKFRELYPPQEEERTD